MTQQKSKAPSRQTIEQERGREAWEDIKSVKDMQSVKSIASDYRALARGLNAMIQVNGLGQTLGFLRAKGKDKDDKGKPMKNAYYALLEHLTHWMYLHFTTEIEDVREGKNYGLLDWVLRETTSSSDYRRATTECLAFGRWLSRFAEAELSDAAGKANGSREGTVNG